MKKSLHERIERVISRYRVTDGRDFRLRDIDPADTAHLNSKDKAEAREWLERGVDWLAEQQDMLYAQDHWAVLLVFQAMDAAGKDGTIKHVTSGINPQGCQVVSYKRPSDEELDHDYLWRYMRHVPARGQIGIFNRSYYEEVLVVKVHEELLRRQKIPPSLVTKKIWERRYEAINEFERLLGEGGMRVIKCFLHISKDEQRERLQERLSDPTKYWKFNRGDLAERKRWDEYQAAYEDALTLCNTKHAPWHIIPSDRKWYRNLCISRLLVKSLTELDPRFPPPEDGIEKIVVE